MPCHSLSIGTGDGLQVLVAGARPLSLTSLLYRSPGRVHTALEGSVSGLGGRKWVKESAIEAEHASARKLFNSSLPWSLGSGDDTSAKHTPPVSMMQRPRCFSAHARRMRLLVRLIPEGAASATTITNISLARHSCRYRHVVFSPHFRKGEEAMKGRGASTGNLTTARGVYDAAVTSLFRPYHITHAHTYTHTSTSYWNVEWPDPVAAAHWSSGCFY